MSSGIQKPPLRARQPEQVTQQISVQLKHQDFMWSFMLYWAACLLLRKQLLPNQPILGAALTLLLATTGKSRWIRSVRKSSYRKQLPKNKRVHQHNRKDWCFTGTEKRSEAGRSFLLGSSFILEFLHSELLESKTTETRDNPKLSNYTKTAPSNSDKTYADISAVEFPNAAAPWAGHQPP